MLLLLLLTVAVAYSYDIQSLNIIVKPSLRLVAAFFSAVMVSK